MRTLIIAEAGVNHNGDLTIAKKLIEAAAEAGADYVKFQTFKADKLVSKTAKKASYQLHTTEAEDDLQWNMLKKLELPEDWHFELKEYAAQRSIGFLSTGFDEESIDFLDSLGVDMIKIPSGEITNKPYLEHAASKGKPVILSTGMADLSEVSSAVNVLVSGGLQKDKLILLHCNTEYPTPMEDVNLLALKTLSEHFNLRTGYSDHTIGYEVPVAAVALGATVIEKHFTLDRTLPGPDHLASLEPHELKKMVAAIRNVELAVAGSGKKEPSKSETGNKTIIRKSLHYRYNLPAGHKLKKDDLIALRPGTGISPMQIDQIIDKELVIAVSANDMVAIEKLK